MASSKTSAARFFHIVLVVNGIVLVWRGIWYALDKLDTYLFGGSHLWTAFGGIIFGIVILYLPDSDLKELEKL
jgi:hypothetical protein